MSDLGRCEKDRFTTVEVSAQDISKIVAMWRSANEAPGGITPQDAIKGMRDAVWHLEEAHRNQTGSPSC